MIHLPDLRIHLGAPKEYPRLHGARTVRPGLKPSRPQKKWSCKGEVGEKYSILIDVGELIIWRLGSKLRCQFLDSKNLGQSFNSYTSKIKPVRGRLVWNFEDYCALTGWQGILPTPSTSSKGWGPCQHSRFVSGLK